MRITQSSCFLSSLIAECAAGIMQPAAMQRPYVWTAQDVEDLCDSILSRFPIGSFLLWAPGRKADQFVVSKGRLGPLPGVADKKAELLLLDGQNRMATLVWMIVTEFNELPLQALRDGRNPPGAEETQTWLSDMRLVLDGAEKRMMFVPKDEANKGLRLPCWTLVDYGHPANQLLRQRWTEWEQEGLDGAEIEAFFKYHDDCCNAFRDARTTVTTIEDATPEEARSAFLRICRTGVQMSQEDFDKAVNWSPEAA